MPTASHQIERLNGKVIIKDLEIFSGFDPEFDSKDDEHADFGPDKIKNSIAVTKRYMERGQFPQVIIRHNPEDPSEGDRPVVGTLLSVRAGRLGKSIAILSDVEMTEEDFEIYMKSNKYPRRSIEMWPDGQISELALLSSETPARPLPDTKFDRNSATGEIEKYRFARNFPPLKFGDHPMPDDKMIAKMRQLEDENEDLKKQLKAKSQADDDDEKEKMKNQADDEDDKDDKDDEDSKKSKNSKTYAELQKTAAKMQKRAEKAETRLDGIEMKLQREQYGRKLDSLHAEGYQVGTEDSDDREELLTEIVTSVDPEAKLTFLKKHIRKLTLRKHIDTSHARSGDAGSEEKIELQQKAAKSARLRVDEEHEKTNDYTLAQRKYGKYYQEELKKLGVDGKASRVDEDAA